MFKMIIRSKTTIPIGLKKVRQKAIPKNVKGFPIRSNLFSLSSLSMWSNKGGIAITNIIRANKQINICMLDQPLFSKTGRIAIRAAPPPAMIIKKPKKKLRFMFAPIPYYFVSEKNHLKDDE